MTSCISSSSIFVFCREVVDSNLFHLWTRAVVRLLFLIRTWVSIAASVKTCVHNLLVLEIFVFFFELFKLDLFGLHYFFVADQLLIMFQFFLLEFWIKFFLILLELVNFFLQNFDVQLKLLLNFDVVTDFSFVLLELLLVFLRRQIDWLEGRCEFRSCSVIVSLETIMFRFWFIV